MHQKKATWVPLKCTPSDKMKIITFVTILWQKYLCLKAACHHFKCPSSLSFSVPVWCHFASLLPHFMSPLVKFEDPPWMPLRRQSFIHCTEIREIWPAPHSWARRNQWLWWRPNSASWTNLASSTNSTNWMVRWGKRDCARKTLYFYPVFCHNFGWNLHIPIVGMLGAHDYRFSIVTCWQQKSATLLILGKKTKTLC